jgi:hypothetical protein
MSKRPGLSIYLVAALLSNTPLMFFVLILTFIEPTVLIGHQVLLQLLFFCVMFSGAALAGYLLVRRFVQRTQVLGLTTGSLAYVIYMIYTILFYRELMVLGGYWPILAFLSGGIAGAQLRHMVHRRKSRSSRG